MTPSLRKFALTIHITLSVGWIGAVLQALREAVATVARTSPLRAPMDGILGQLEMGGVRSTPQPLFISLVALCKAAGRVLGPRVAADVFDSVRNYAKDCDPGAARAAERWLRRLPRGYESARTNHH